MSVYIEWTLVPASHQLWSRWLGTGQERLRKKGGSGYLYLYTPRVHVFKKWALSENKQNPD